jgi:hypothetical protein
LKETRTHYEGFDDEIQVAPTGVSGTAYNSHNLHDPSATNTN